MIDWLGQLDDISLKRDVLMMGSNETELKMRGTEVTLKDDSMSSAKQHKPAIIESLKERWNPEYAQQGYVWCFDCQHFDSVNCNHTDNPFNTVTKCPQVPRKCQWYEEIN